MRKNLETYIKAKSPAICSTVFGTALHEIPSRISGYEYKKPKKKINVSTRGMKPKPTNNYFYFETG